ncbi:FACT complex subunit SSRP1 [Caerostris darwini]|uniref:FACT complex subunit SSRP1 n=1 Tax=Caerostris darwini TaxID=1538125 RepID=A0AAV4S966_9ARAC|nr:FACT complex subunit SSRP1 [Caerostris darwini]
MKAAEDYIKTFSDLIKAQGYISQQVFNCDETGLFWKKMPNRTYITAEEKMMPGHKPMKDRLTLALCANASGDCKIKPLLVYHSENPRAFKSHKILKEKLQVMWRSNPKAWVTRKFFVEWVNLVFGPTVKKYLQENNLPVQALLILDNAPAHPPNLEDDILEELKFIKVLYLPPNTTPILQPMDQQVISNFKKLYTKHLFRRCFEVTESTNLTLREFWKDHFNIAICLQIIDQAWLGVTTKTLTSAWKKLWPEAVAERIYEELEPGVSVEEEIVSLGKSMGLEVEERDVNELIEEYTQELTTEEIQELQSQQHTEVMQEIGFEESEEELSLDPPIKQGQTRYQFLILLFSKEEETTVDLSLSEEDIKEKYEDKLQKEMSGPTFEVISRVMKAIVQRKITVPGSFKGHSGTQAVTCSYRAGNGLLYPLERGLIYVHKPPVHIRFDEIACVNFARSGGSTRSFDFEIEIKTGMVHTFSSIEKEEYGRLFDFINLKKLRIKNCNLGLKSKEKPTYKEDLVDSDVEDEPDAYLQRVKAEGREREEGGGSTDEESSDESFAPEESGSEVAEEYDSNPPTSSDSDEDYEGSDKSSGDDSDKGPKKVKEKKHKEPKKSKSAKTVKEPGMRKKRQKKVRDENKPKRPPSAFFIFLGDMREKIKKDNPGISITETTKKAGEMWKETTDKTKWEERAGVLKKEYEKAMAEYKASEKASPSTEVSKEQKTPKKKDKKSSQAVKSPIKSPGSFKSKEYISSSDSSDAEGKKKDSDSDEEKMEIDESAASGSD